MTDPKSITLWNRKGDDSVDVLYLPNPDGVTYSQSLIGDVQIKEDLKIGSKSVTLVLSTGLGSVEIPDTTTLVGVKPVSSNVLRVGLETPEAIQSITGTVTLADLKNGVTVDGAIWTWFNIGVGSDRIFYVKGFGSEVIEVVVM